MNQACIDNRSSYVERYWREVGAPCLAPEAITELERRFHNAGFSDDQISMSVLIMDRFMRSEPLPK